MRSTTRPMPRNAKLVKVSSTQYARIFLRGRRSHPVQNESVYVLARKGDGSTWVRMSGSGAMFWAERWFEIPKVVYERAEKIDDFVSALVA